MNISQLAYRYRPVLLLCLALSVLYGISNYFALPAREDPKIVIREALASTSYPGLSAEQVEEKITKPLEASIREVGEVESISSTSMRGRSLIHIEVRDEFFDLDQIWDEVRQKILNAYSRLPSGTQKTVLNDDFGDVAVVTAALMSDVYSHAEQLEMAEHIRAELYLLDGTKRVELLGVQEEKIYIDLPEARLAELGLSPGQLTSQLQQRNILPPAAQIEAGEQRFAVQVSGSYNNLEDLANAEIQLPNNDGSMRLGDLGTIERGYQEPASQTAYFNGKRAIVLAISMLDGRSVLDYGHKVKDVITRLQSELPAGYQLQTMTFQAEQVANAVYGVTSSVLQTLAIVLAVVILFLGMRTGLIVGSLIPAVMLVTLAIMGFMDMSLQRMSLATLVISLGLLVDNAIVVAEDFKTRLESGDSRDEALRTTGAELALPLLSSTLTTILVFLPLMLANHVAGEYTRSISIVIAITLSTSWFLSLTVTPVLCHRFLTIPPKPQTRDEAKATLSDQLFQVMSSRYDRLIRHILAHRIIFLCGMAILLIVGVGLMQLVPKKFFPDSDRNQVLVYLDFPVNISPTLADESIQFLSADILNTPELADGVDSVAGYAGFGGPRFVLSLTPIDPAVNKGFLVINVSQRDQVDTIIDRIKTYMRERHPEVRAQVVKMFLGPSDSNLLEVQIKGPDREVLFNAASQAKAILARQAGAEDIKHSWEARVSAIDVDVNQAQARAAGVTSEDIAHSLQGAIDGYQLSRYREGDKLIPIVLRNDKEERNNLERLRSLTVYPLESNGRGVPLNQVAEIKLTSGYGRIDREDLVRTITVQARSSEFTAEQLQPIVANDFKTLEASLPSGHWIEYDGVVKMSAEGQSALQKNLPMCIGLIFILLVAQFNSFKRPMLIVLTIPLVIVGVATGLLIMRADFGFMVLLGLYSLAGIIINNAIVLIDRIDIDRQDANLKAAEAIVRASVRRLRPIIMSTVTTVLGFLPLILSHDPLFYGMASAMAFGLAVGTVMSLLVVPVLYSYAFNIPVDTIKNKPARGDVHA
ncbi:efflux RND transporter permease subunit [Gilvimarinus agarilyticus]|uniref:efflux RND transporter permease subunit n=1 Tax=Gilvimarinus sp. 2_MG-2023 TaxID=3062666 RepID=UPI001C090A25|nr:efflux RND transporter permease subunit [Gilvimarinus sp. 2_MG-2023]MBU2886552.1 efflux RND transporter permease subunit [Gilvimarinus agarilyticus]MDO6571220.1 efflux RND transporter permease subunit [Gilvimarinus sp. 2_MG-2023]